MEGWHLCRSAKGTCSGRSESRTHKAHRSAVFETAAIAHWLALPLRAAEAGIEPAGYAFNRRAHATNSSPSAIESAQLDLNQRSPASGAGGIARLSHTPMQERPAGVEPAHPPWQGSRLPLHHGRVKSFQLSKNNQSPEHRAGLEPAFPHYGCGVLAAERPVHFFNGTRGIRTLTT